MRFQQFVALLIALAISPFIKAQSVRMRVVDSLTREPLVGVTIRTTTTPPTGYVTDATGEARLTSFPSGLSNLLISFVGYEPKSVRLLLPLPNPDSTVTILLATAQAALDEVTVTATRTNSRLEDLPIKVEVLGQEDMDEEAAVVPGNVGSILGDISIIHIQRTSLTTGNQGIRMQGLDPKYTQILRDGLPLYEGFSGNLGVLQIPPLDLKQVEVVKGSASTLYGGGAIGGLINLVSRRPGHEPELTAVLNRSTLRESNANVYYGQQFSAYTGLTVFGGYTDQPALDVNGDGFVDSPQIRQFTLHPRLFLSPSPTNKINVGYTFIDEQREGGDIEAIDQVAPGRTYVVSNSTRRHTVDATVEHTFATAHTFTARATTSLFDRTQTSSGYVFGGRQTSAYVELTDYLQRGAHTMVAGLNLTHEQFRKSAETTSPITDFTYNTLGAFVQDDYRIGQQVTLQGGLRLDQHNVYGTFFLPRLSMLVKPSEHWSVRTSIGTGYKTPNVFANFTGADLQTNNINYQTLLPLIAGLKAERSLGLNMDVAYTGTIGDLTVQLDQAFYYTVIDNPVLATTTLLDRSGVAAPYITLQNAQYALRSIGTDTYLRMTLHELELYLGYNHTIARRLGTSSQFPQPTPISTVQTETQTNIGAGTYLPFSPQDKFSLTAAYEIEGKWRFGIESSWIGNQYLYDNQRVPNYWFWAGALERAFGPLSIVLNAENLFNIQQIQFGPVVTGTPQAPLIAPLWAPQEGRIVNLALRYKMTH